uniref:Uncharacterized protein n=1 Tax=Ascaris lumbricoides TaxID=6252 RepID=A0A0M3IR07_ASCLU
MRHNNLANLEDIVPAMDRDNSILWAGKHELLRSRPLESRFINDGAIIIEYPRVRLSHFSKYTCVSIICPYALYGGRFYPSCILPLASVDMRRRLTADYIPNRIHQLRYQ